MEVEVDHFSMKELIPALCAAKATAFVVGVVGFSS